MWIFRFNHGMMNPQMNHRMHPSMMGGGPNPYYQQQAAWHGPVHGGPRGGPGFG